MATVKTKGDIVLLALRKAAIASNSTLTEPEPQMVDDALTDLELMIAEWENEGIHIGFYFADDEYGPDTNEDHKVLPGDINAVAFCLAKRILTDSLRAVPDSLATQADSAYTAMLYRQVRVPPLVRRNDMPRGQGNKAWATTGRFYVEPDIQNDLETGDGTPIA